MTLFVAGATRTPLSDRLHHVDDASHWDDRLGTDYDFTPSAAQIAGTGNREDLTDVGWSKTGLTFVPGSGADFLTEAVPGIPPHYTLDGASNLLQSPDKFGNFEHCDGAADHLGYHPTTMMWEGWFQFSVTGSNEPASGIGLVDAGGSIITAGDAVAVIHSNGSNFVCRSSADSDVGAVVDTDWHRGGIVLSLGTTDKIEWFIDRVSQGTLDLRTGVMPLAWGAGAVSAGNNRLAFGHQHISYR